MRFLSMLVVLVGAVATVRGQDRPGPGPQGPNVERIFNVLDLDKDGKIDRTELEKRLPELLNRLRESHPVPGAIREERSEPARPREGAPPPAPAAEARRRPGRDGSRGPAPAAVLGTPPPEIEERMERTIGKHVRDLFERHMPRLADRVNELVERHLREMMERRMPEMKERIERLVEKKVREILARERPEPAGRPESPAFVPSPLPFETERPYGWRSPSNRPPWRGPMNWRSAEPRFPRSGWFQDARPFDQRRPAAWRDRRPLQGRRPFAAPGSEHDRRFEESPKRPNARAPECAQDDDDSAEPRDTERPPRPASRR